MRLPRRLFAGRRALGGLALLLAAALAVVLFAARRAAPAADAAPPDAPALSGAAPSAGAFASDVAIPVQGAAAVRDTLVIAVTAAGQAEAVRRVAVTALVGGRVAAVAARESQAVAPGQALVALDPVEHRLALQEAEAALRDAQARYRELTLLNEEIADTATRAERERVARARSGLEAAEVKLQRAQLELQRTRVTAPFAGRVANLKAVPGQWVRPGDELLTLVALDPIRVEVQVLEGEIGFLAPGARASVALAAFPGERFAGRIASLNPLVEGSTRTARVTLLVPNPRGRILPGMYARVALDARRFPDRVLVPRAAVLERDRRPMLFVVEDGRAKWRYVTPGLQNDSLVEIVPGTETDSVRAGELVLVDGHYTLVHDARVRLVEDVARAGGRPH